MAPKSTAAAAVILGLTLVVNMAASARSPTRFERQMTALVQPAIQVCKEKSLPHQFWNDLASGTVNHCVKEFADELKRNYNALDIDVDVDMLEMYEDIQFEVVEDCSDKFTESVRDMIDVVTPIEDLDYLTGAYRLDEDNDEEELAAVVADVVKLMDRQNISSVDEFKQIYRESGPCSKFYEYLNQVPDHDAYVNFLQLLTVPEYHSIAQWSHMAMVDFMFACDYVQDNDKLLEAAFGVYQDLPDIDSTYDSESMLDTGSHESDLDMQDEDDNSQATESPAPESVDLKSHPLSESDGASINPKAK